MITVKYEDNNKPRTMPAKDIKVGTLFSGNQDRHKHYKGVFLRTYSGIVSLEKPEEWVWDNNSLTAFGFENYVELDGHLKVWPKSDS